MPKAKAAAPPMMPISRAKAMAIVKAKARLAAGESDDGAGGATFFAQEKFLGQCEETGDDWPKW